MAHLLFAGDVRVEVDEGRMDELSTVLIIQCDDPEALRQAIAARRIEFSLFDRPAARAVEPSDLEG